MRCLSEIFGDISGMLAHQFLIILNFLYVCQSVSWLTFLLKLHKYWDISSSGQDFFLKFVGNIPCMFLQHYPIITNFLYVCQSVSWLTSWLKLYRDRNIFRSCMSISLYLGMSVHYFLIILSFLYVCQSVSWLTSLLILGKYGDISSSVRDIFLKFSGHIPWMLAHQF